MRLNCSLEQPYPQVSGKRGARKSGKAGPAQSVATNRTHTAQWLQEGGALRTAVLAFPASPSSSPVQSDNLAITQQASNGTW